ncbi:MAG: flavin reductase family protein [Cypionkella sp.]
MSDADARRHLRDAFGTFMTGVTVVTTMAYGKPLGFTANSFSSVSLEPPLLQVSIARSSANYASFVEAKGFAINILAENQRDISNTFARPVEDRFSAVKWQMGPYGAPVLKGVSAWFDCSPHQIVEAGDHALLIGRVEGFAATNATGLGYYRGSYFTATAAAVAPGPDVVISAIIERDGGVFLIDDGLGGLTLPTAKVGRDGASAAFTRLLASMNVQATAGFIYAVFEDTARSHQHIAFRSTWTGGKPAKGAFVDLASDSLTDITDPALRVMLDRLAEETRHGNYGIYFGNQTAGRVAKVTGDQP